MQRDFRHFELPGKFVGRYRPVRVHAHEKGLAAYALDEYGLRFFRVMATGAYVPPEAIWTINRQPSEHFALQLVNGRPSDACGFVVCEVPYVGDATAYPVPPRLSYRTKVTIAALQSLLADLAADPAGADVIATIERRIEQLRT
jgi:hypothetical protein